MLRELTDTELRTLHDKMIRARLRSAETLPMRVTDELNVWKDAMDVWEEADHEMYRRFLERQ